MKTQQAIDLNTAPAGQLIKLAGVKQLTGRGRATIFRWVDQGILPKPRKLGSTLNYWTAGEIRDALAKAMGGAQ